MRREFIHQSGRVAVALVLATTVSAATAQDSTLYITNGDGARLAIVQGGVLQGVATTHDKGYPIAVRDSI